VYGPAIIGFLSGFFILHPVATVIMHLLTDTGADHACGPGQCLVSPFLQSFRLNMFPMGLGFGLLGAVIGLVYGYQRRVIRLQRDDLVRQLARNEALVKDLRQQNNRLVELERMKRRTTGFLVHDFKTQLNCIEGFSDLLLEEERGRGGQTPRMELVRIRRQARAMLSSVNNLLDISRLEDAPALQRMATSPQELLESTAKEVAVAGRDVSIHVDEEARRCPDVMVDRKLISRVLDNLAHNAVKHNGPRVRIALSATTNGDRSKVTFSCGDDGEGIAPDRLETLFEPYEIGECRSKESTGLGLAFAKSAIEAHGGRIWCESSPGNGACFYFTLSPERNADMTTDQETPKHVLVVDDEPDFAALMESILRGQGYSVSVASNGEEALDRVRARGPDAITLDIQMPKKSGLLFYRQMKSDKALRDIPVIVVTGLPNEDPEWDGLIHSFLDADNLPHPKAYLTKPVDREKVAELLEEIFAE